NSIMDGQIRVTVVGLDAISLFVYDGNNSLIDSGRVTRQIGNSIMLSIQRENQTDQRLDINSNSINLDNILANPGHSHQQTVEGVQLKIEYISARPGTFQEDAGGASI
ncbi:2981_t:CDS:2, partial [Entrophospora sp. SA101]